MAQILPWPEQRQPVNLPVAFARLVDADMVVTAADMMPLDQWVRAQVDMLKCVATPRLHPVFLTHDAGIDGVELRSAVGSSRRRCRERGPAPCDATLLIDLKALEAVGTHHPVDGHKKRIDEMSLGLGNHRKAWRGGPLALALSCSLLAAVSMSPTVAHEHEEMCGPIIDGDGEPVLQSDGDILLHGGSFPCPPEEVPAESVAIETVRSVILFDFDIDVPKGEGESALEEIIEELRGLSPDRVVVNGHADRAGTEAYNQDLSQRRANNIAKRLIAGGIDASSMTIEAFGETQPAVLTDDGVREPANRRVEIESAF